MNLEARKPGKAGTNPDSLLPSSCFLASKFIPSFLLSFSGSVED